MGSGHLHIPKERNLKPLVFLIVFLLAAAMFCSYLTENRVRTSKHNFYFVPAIKYLSVISATHKTFWGYLFFIRGVLDLNEKFPPGINRMDYLLANFRAAGMLEPKLTRAYFFGGVVTPLTRAEILQAISFLENAWKSRAQDWNFPFWVGLNYLELGDYAKAAEYYQKAAQLPGSPNYLKTNLPFFYYRAGEFNQGIAYLQALMLSLDDKRLMEIIERKIEWLKNLALLEDRVDKYFKIYGQYPQELKDLKDKNLIREIPEDSFGRGFYLEKKSDSLKPKVKSRM
jgi:tetratricopeptide (TPR) repeat protein